MSRGLDFETLFTRKNAKERGYMEYNVLVVNNVTAAIVMKRKMEHRNHDGNRDIFSHFYVFNSSF